MSVNVYLPPGSNGNRRFSEPAHGHLMNLHVLTLLKWAVGFNIRKGALGIC